jgi:hypothetical protein
MPDGGLSDNNNAFNDNDDTDRPTKTPANGIMTMWAMKITQR